MRLKTLTLCYLLICGTALAQNKGRDTYIPKESPVPCLDSMKILCIGNSFTYFYDAPHKLQEIAAFEGHYLDVTVSVKGGGSCRKHLVYEPTVKAVAKGGYDVAFIQDQSQAAARYFKDRKAHPYVGNDFETLADYVKTYSRDCRIILERTWSFPDKKEKTAKEFGSEEKFDELIGKGARKIARHYGADLSPIGDAFSLSRRLYPEIELLHSDCKHSGPAGMYLKACVNYLILYRQDFGPNPSNCDLDPETAAKLRSVARSIVLKKR